MKFYKIAQQYLRSRNETDFLEKAKKYGGEYILKICWGSMNAAIDLAERERITREVYSKSVPEK